MEDREVKQVVCEELCVTTRYVKDVCERWCVTKRCVKDGVRGKRTVCRVPRCRAETSKHVTYSRDRRPSDEAS